MVLFPLETILNRNIAASSAALRACKRLSGKTLVVHVDSAPQNTLLSLYFRCHEQRISIATKSAAPTSAALHGTPRAYLSMLRTAPESALQAGCVRIDGDAEAAQSFRDLLKAARPQLEEELARAIGD